MTNIIDFFYNLYENIINYIFNFSEEKSPLKIENKTYNIFSNFSYDTIDLRINILEKQIFDVYSKSNIILIQNYCNFDSKNISLEGIKELMLLQINEIKNNNINTDIKEINVYDIEKITILNDQINNIKNIIEKDYLLNLKNNIDEDIRDECILEIMSEL
jgi:hypothetical protein